MSFLAISALFLLYIHFGKSLWFTWIPCNEASACRVSIIKQTKQTKPQTSMEAILTFPPALVSTGGLGGKFVWTVTYSHRPYSERMCWKSCKQKRHSVLFFLCHCRSWGSIFPVAVSKTPRVWQGVIGSWKNKAAREWQSASFWFASPSYLSLDHAVLSFPSSKWSTCLGRWEKFESWSPWASGKMSLVHEARPLALWAEAATSSKDFADQRRANWYMCIRSRGKWIGLTACGCATRQKMKENRDRWHWHQPVGRYSLLQYPNLILQGTVFTVHLLFVDNLDGKCLTTGATLRLENLGEGTPGERKQTHERTQTQAETHTHKETETGQRAHHAKWEEAVALVPRKTTESDRKDNAYVPRRVPSSYFFSTAACCEDFGILSSLAPLKCKPSLSSSSRFFQDVPGYLHVRPSSSERVSMTQA